MTAFVGLIATLSMLSVACSACADDVPGPDWAAARELHLGVRLTVVSVAEPRRMVVHCVRIDLSTPGLGLCATPRAAEWDENKTETLRQTTRDFLRRSRSTTRPVVFAVNGDAFSPWPAPWNRPTPTDLAGLAVEDGVVVSPPSGSPSLLITKTGEASIAVTKPGMPTDHLRTAVSGFALCLIDGVPQPSGDDLHPRTGLGLSADGRKLFVLAIDGRRHSRQGATTRELGEWLKRCGADDGINMDGGGSTTLAWWNPKAPSDDKCELLNTPVGNGIRYESELIDRLYFPTERTNGNNLGVYFQQAP